MLRWCRIVLDMQRSICNSKQRRITDGDWTIDFSSAKGRVPGICAALLSPNGPENVRQQPLDGHRIDRRPRSLGLFRVGFAEGPTIVFVELHEP
jgi:hypothetical protein